MTMRSTEISRPRLRCRVPRPERQARASRRRATSGTRRPDRKRRPAHRPVSTPTQVWRLCQPSPDAARPRLSAQCECPQTYLVSNERTQRSDRPAKRRASHRQCWVRWRGKARLLPGFDRNYERARANRRRRFTDHKRQTIRRPTSTRSSSTYGGGRSPAAGLASSIARSSRGGRGHGARSGGHRCCVAIQRDWLIAARAPCSFRTESAHGPREFAGTLALLRTCMVMRGTVQVRT